VPNVIFKNPFKCPRGGTLPNTKPVPEWFREYGALHSKVRSRGRNRVWGTGTDELLQGRKILGGNELLVMSGREKRLTGGIDNGLFLQGGVNLLNTIRYAKRKDVPLEKKTFTELRETSDQME